MLWGFEQKKALFCSAFFAFLGAVFATAAAAAPSCETATVDRRITVAAVLDGDTLRLQDGNRLRLIGIDAPERATRNLAAEPGAAEAKRALQDRLPPGAAVLLRFDHQRRDRYQRLLAHAFLEDGTNLQAWLLAQGLARQHAVPPNLHYLECYTAAEEGARAAERGLWRLPSHRLAEADALQARPGEFRRIHGRVRALHSSRHQVRLELSGGLSLLIERDDLGYFEHQGVGALRNREVIARGRLFPLGSGMALRLRHPVQLQIVR